MAKEYKDLVVGLDIGTSKVMAVVAEVMADGQLKIAGLGIAPGNGLKRGVVVNIDATVQSIQQALKEAELMADCKITRVNVGITGSHIRGINSSGMVAIKDKEVTQADLARVMETARAINISSDQRLLLVAPQEFVIDSQEVKEPIGMSGMRLEAKVHIVTGAQSAAENIIKCVRRCGLEVDQLLLNPQSSSLAVLSEDERELGVVCVDIGAGTTDVAIFANGSIRHTAVIPIAGDLITSDIAMALRTPTKDAEDIKVESGNAKQLLADPDAQVEVPGGEDMTQDEAFSHANDVLKNAVGGIAEIINVPGHVNVDFEDVRTVMGEPGKAMMGTAAASGPDRARIAAEQAVACPLLEGVDLKGARGVLVLISAAKGSLKLSESKQAMNTIRDCASEDAHVIYGTAYDESLGDQIRVTVVATGLAKAGARRASPPLQVLRTGTDNAPFMMGGQEAVAPTLNTTSPAAANGVNIPAYWRNNRTHAATRVDGMSAAGMDDIEIPAFLRKQAD